MFDNFEKFNNICIGWKISLAETADDHIVSKNYFSIHNNLHELNNNKYNYTITFSRNLKLNLYVNLNLN